MELSSEGRLGRLLVSVSEQGSGSAYVAVDKTGGDVAGLRVETRAVLAQPSADGHLNAILLNVTQAEVGGDLAALRSEASPARHLSQLREQTLQAFARASADGRLDSLLSA